MKSKVLTIIAALFAILMLASCSSAFVAENGAALENEAADSPTTSIHVFYKTTWSTPHIHYRTNNTAWTTAPGYEMIDSWEYPGYKTYATFHNSEMEFVFNDGNGTWDNNNSQNYIKTISGFGRYDVFVVDGVMYDEPPVDGKGFVNVRVLGDTVENGQIVSSPLNEVGVYLGDWHAGNRIGTTDSNGYTTVELDAGVQELSVMKMTSSHSILAGYGHEVTVVAGQTVSFDIHVAPTQVNITANYQTPWGKALYITGSTDYLGNWGTAYKMTISNQAGDAWKYYTNLPIGAEFKVVLADWVEGNSISTSGVQWEQGSNHVIPAPYQYYESVVTYSPVF
jgi:hypothetical protein